MSEEVRKATYDDVDRLIHHLARAFDDDPMMNYMVRQDDKRDAGFNALLRVCLCTLALPHDEVYAIDDCTGGALWYPPGTSDIGLAKQLSMLPDMIRVASFRGFRRMIDIFSVLDKIHPDEKHYYLQIIGVDPDQQGKGLGSALMRPALALCDGEGCGAYLENSKEANLAFYKRHGFEVTGEIDLGPEAPPVWSMWRDPQ